MKIRQLATISFLLSFCITCCGQGMMIHAGTSSMSSKLTSLTPENSAHTGFHVGADGRIGDDGFYFLIGLGYHKLDFNPTDDFTLKVSDPNFGIIKGKGGVAFRIFQINDDIQTRLRIMGALDYILNSPQMGSSENPANLDFNEGVAGVIGGLEIDIYFMTLQLEYQKGFFKSVKETENSSLDFITMGLGVNF